MLKSKRVVEDTNQDNQKGWMTRVARLLPATLLAVGLVLASTISIESNSPAEAGTSYKIAAVGDMECGATSPKGPGLCQSAAVSALIQSENPYRFMALGDTQYEYGSYSAYLKYYDKTWGDLKSITWPTVGNHEWYTKNAAGYAAYFGSKYRYESGRYFYKRQVGNWMVYSIDSNCGKINCKIDGKQFRWLSAQLQASPLCTIVAYHAPIISSYTEHVESRMGSTWRMMAKYKVDVVLNAHVHDYERFTPMDASRNPDPNGIQLFTTGTGGKNTTAVEGRIPQSEVFISGTYGALFLTLNTNTYDWAFKGTDGTTLDSGSGSCH